MTRDGRVRRQPGVVRRWRYVRSWWPPEGVSRWRSWSETIVDCRRYGVGPQAVARKGVADESTVAGRPAAPARWPCRAPGRPACPHPNPAGDACRARTATRAAAHTLSTRSSNRSPISRSVSVPRSSRIAADHVAEAESVVVLADQAPHAIDAFVEQLDPTCRVAPRTCRPRPGPRQSRRRPARRT